MDEIRLLGVGMVCFMIFTVSSGIHLLGFVSPEMDFACEKLGYDKYDIKMNTDGCIGMNGFTFVYMKCHGLFWNTKCVAIPIEIGTVGVS